MAATRFAPLVAAIDTLSAIVRLKCRPKRDAPRLQLMLSLRFLWNLFATCHCIPLSRFRHLSSITQAPKRATACLYSWSGCSCFINF
eukprot:1298018-Amphidinium_carterae.1